MGLTAGWKTSSHIPLLLLLLLLFLILSFLPPSFITLAIPSGGPATPITLLLLPGRGDSLTHTHTPYTVTVPSPHYQSMSLAAGDRQVRLILLFFFLLSFYLSSLSSFPHSPSLSQAARGTNWRPAELNVPGAESQMVLAEGWRERKDGCY